MNISSSTDEKNISQAPIKKNTPVKQTHFRMRMYQDHFVKKILLTQSCHLRYSNLGRSPTVPVFLWENELLPKRGKGMDCQLVLKRNWASHSHNQHKNLTITRQKLEQQASSPIFYKIPSDFTLHFVTSLPLLFSLKATMLDVCFSHISPI